MPLHEAVQSGRKDLVEWLLQQHQGSVNVTNSNGRTPLHIAAITNNVDMCKVLMDYGAFINPIMKNSKNQHLTPLDAALHRGNRGCAKYLNLHGALPASKLLEKRDYNRFTENHLSQTIELSPGTKWRLLRDSSAQTESSFKQADVQARTATTKSASATAELSKNTSPVEIKNSCTGKNIRCNAVEGSGKPIIAKVYVHTKRSKMKRTTRKPTAYRRDCNGEKLPANDQKRQSVNFQCPDNGASNNQTDIGTPQQTDFEKDIPSRKASEPALYEDPFLPVPEEDFIPRDDFSEFGEDKKFAHTLEEAEEQEEARNTLPTLEEPNFGFAHPCDCFPAHQEDVNSCDCNCHEDRAQLLSPNNQRRRSSLRTQESSLDMENHSPLSSIRSLESTIKDSGFSDDVSRCPQMSSSDDDRTGHSDTEETSTKYGRRRRSRRHIARYVVSSGAAENFRLEEDDEKEDEKISKPRSSSLPQLRKREEHYEVCPRLLNRPTMTKEVQRSLKKYQMERRLFYELQELKRKQITSSPYDEREVVQKILERFRNHVLSPFMSDFEGPLTFRAFEKYLYEQLRKLSMGGRIPKPKSITKERIYVGPSLRKNSQLNQALCVCGSRKCHHKGHIHDSDLSLTKIEDNHIPILPDITQSVHHIREPTFHAKSTRSKSWDRLDDNRKTDSTFGTTDLEKDLKTSNSLPSLTNPFPRRVPAALLAAINERLGPDVHPEDTIVVEMSSAGNSSSKMRHAFTVQELQEVVSRYEEQVGRKVKPIPLESVLDADDDGPITFEIRHGRERNVFKLPAAKLKNNKKWQVTFTIGKNQKSLLAK